MRDNSVLGVVLGVLEDFLIRVGELSGKALNGHRIYTALEKTVLGIIATLLIVFVFFKAQWFFAISAWWACSELTKIRVAMQEEIRLRRGSHEK